MKKKKKKKKKLLQSSDVLQYKGIILNIPCKYLKIT